MHQINEIITILILNYRRKNFKAIINKGHINEIKQENQKRILAINSNGLNPTNTVKIEYLLESF